MSLCLDYINQHRGRLVMLCSGFLLMALSLYSPEMLAKTSDYAKAQAALDDLYGWFVDAIGILSLGGASIAFLKGGYDISIRQDIASGSKALIGSLILGGVGGKLALSATLAVV